MLIKSSKVQQIHHLFEEQVSLNPNSIALIFQDEKLTYKELNERSNQLAHLLIKKGVKRGSMVGLLLERSPKMIIALLAILKSGGVYVPLNPADPPARITFILNDTEITTLFVQTKIKYGIVPEMVDIIDLDDENIIKSFSKNNPINSSGEDDLAYVCYTSGSTGTPKGVLVTHQGVVRLVKDTNYLNFSSEQIFLQFAPVTFDAATFEIWGGLLNGAQLVLVPKLKVSLEELGNIIVKFKITTLWLTAGLFHQMVENHLEHLLNIKYLLAGGDVLSVYHVKKVLKEIPGITLINGYGPTENTTFSCYYSMTEESQIDASVPIGVPISNTDVFILNRELKLVSDGEIGELYLGGKGLAKGYLNRPDLTNEKFISNPFSSEGKLYKTGDLARYLPDGNIEFLGREDNQIKLRGYRIELGEIEAYLGRHPFILESVVTVNSRPDGEKILLAYYTTREKVSPNQLRLYLEGKIPSYMVPNHFIELEKFTLTLNGKIDRLQLPLPQINKYNQKILPPKNQVEKQIAEIWAEVFYVKYSDISLYDDFFQCGGHSLLAVRLISQIHKSFGITITYEEFFKATTIINLAKLIKEKKEDEIEVNTLVPLENEPGKEFPLSFSQEQLWVLDKLAPNNPVYNVISAHRLKGKPSNKLLEISINKVINRHEILRTVFKVDKEGKPFQRILPKVYLRLEERTCSNINGVPIEEEPIIINEARKPFNLSEGPLVRALLLKRDEDSVVLMLTFHHIVMDGWSLDILHREISGFYNEALTGETFQPMALDFKYVDYAFWQRENKGTKEHKKQLGFWKEKLEHVPTFEIPVDYRRPRIKKFCGKNYSFQLNSSLTKKLKKLANKEKSTLYMVLLAAYSELLRQFSGQDEIIIGTHVAGRNNISLENMLGHFVNTLVIRTDLSDVSTYQGLIKNTRRLTIESFANQQISFEEIVKELNPIRHSSYNPFFQVAFTLQNFNTSNLSLLDSESKCILIDNQTSKFDLSLIIEEVDNCLSGRLEFDKELFNMETVSRLASYYEVILEAMSKNVEQKINESLVLSEKDLNFLEVWNSNNVNYPTNELLHRLFEKQVEKRPDEVAVSYNQEKLTYNQLNQRANQLARYMIDKGIKRNSVVAIHMDRSMEMVISLLAALKAGCSYLPLDPQYPNDRLLFMYEDSKASFLLTQSIYKNIFCNNEVPVICVDIEMDNVMGYPLNNLGSFNESEDIAYIIYTSGSTGKPKGVQIPHRAICNHMLWMLKRFSLSEVDLTLQKTPFSFDASVWEFYAPLLSGGELVMAKPSAHMDTDYLISIIKEKGITTLQLVPSLLMMLLNNPNFSECISLNWVFCGGEILSSGLVDDFHSKSEAQLVNLYGPTEACIDSTYFICQPDMNYDRVPIGCPIDNVQLYVLNKELKRVPIGVQGELFIGGKGLGIGYINQPNLTAEKFIEVDIYQNKKTKLYKTGDIVRYNSKGEMEYIGRIDRQVKIRGYRIELDEIQKVIMNYPDVFGAVVQDFKSDLGNHIIVAYLLTRNIELTSNDLREYLNKLLPNYMIPNQFIVVDEFPLLPNGKIDLKSLLEIKDSNSVLLKELKIKPRNELEGSLVRIWSELLEHNNIGVTDNFFDVGGHSLLALQLINQLRTEFQVKVSFQILYNNATIKGLAEFIVNENKIKDANSSVVIIQDRDLINDINVDELSDDEVEKLLEQLLERG